MAWRRILSRRNWAIGLGDYFKSQKQKIKRENAEGTDASDTPMRRCGATMADFIASGPQILAGVF
jgi:hypothetical protein